MATEIERKFLVANDSWMERVNRITPIVQGYLVVSEDVTVRVRITFGVVATLTIKGKSVGASRQEFEFNIPTLPAESMLLAFNCPRIEKTRYLVDNRWEVDVFEGANTGLVLAEIELKSEDEEIELPSWVGEEVTHLPEYYNAFLASKEVV